MEHHVALWGLFGNFDTAFVKVHSYTNLAVFFWFKIFLYCPIGWAHIIPSELIQLLWTMRIWVSFVLNFLHLYDERNDGGRRSCDIQIIINHRLSTLLRKHILPLKNRDQVCVSLQFNETKAVTFHPSFWRLPDTWKWSLKTAKMGFGGFMHHWSKNFPTTLIKRHKQFPSLSMLPYSLAPAFGYYSKLHSVTSLHLFLRSLSSRHP